MRSPIFQLAIACFILLNSCDQQDLKTHIQQTEAEVELSIGQQMVSPNQAEQMISAWRTMQANNSVPDIYSIKFDQGSLNAVLDNEDAATIRIYLCAHNAQVDAVMVGLDNEGNDLIEAGIYDKFSPCPDQCPAANSLTTAGNTNPSSELVNHTGQLVSLEDAEQLIENWKAMLANETIPELHAITLNRGSIDAILSNESATTMRMYLAADNGEVSGLLVGVDSDGDDLLEAGIMNMALPCPRECGIESQLQNLE